MKIIFSWENGKELDNYKNGNNGDNDSYSFKWIKGKMLISLVYDLCF